MSRDRRFGSERQRVRTLVLSSRSPRSGLPIKISSDFRAARRLAHPRGRLDRLCDRGNGRRLCRFHDATALPSDQNVLDPGRWLRVVVDFDGVPRRIVTAFVQFNDPRQRS